jgi:hypothetical protein
MRELKYNQVVRIHPVLVPVQGLSIGIVSGGALRGRVRVEWLLRPRDGRRTFENLPPHLLIPITHAEGECVRKLVTLISPCPRSARIWFVLRETLTIYFGMRQIGLNVRISDLLAEAFAKV